MKKLLLCLFIASTSTLASAAVLDDVRILKIHSAFDGNDGVTFKIDKTISDSTCGSKSGFFLPKTLIQSSETYSLLLASSMASKPLRISVSGCNPHGYPILLWVEATL